MNEPVEQYETGVKQLQRMQVELTPKLHVTLSALMVYGDESDIEAACEALSRIAAKAMRRR